RPSRDSSGRFRAARPRARSTVQSCYSTRISFNLEHIIAPGAGAAGISSAVEAEIGRGRLQPGTRLPAVRELAAALGISPATVAAAYRTLNQRGFVVADRGRRTSLA